MYIDGAELATPALLESDAPACIHRILTSDSSLPQSEVLQNTLSLAKALSASGNLSVSSFEIVYSFGIVSSYGTVSSFGPICRL